jgi:hypothetical protein
MSEANDTNELSIERSRLIRYGTPLHCIEFLESHEEMRIIITRGEQSLQVRLTEEEWHKLRTVLNESM